MQLYAHQLMRHMPDNVKCFSLDAFYLPLLEHYFTKELIYPKAAARNQADVNHITDHSYCGLLKTIDQEKTAVTCHDLVPLLYPKTVSRAGRLRYWFNIRLLPKAKKIITSSNFTKKMIIKFFGESIENKIRLIPYGIDDAFKPLSQKSTLRKKYNIADKAILHIGKSYRHKNIDIILEFLKTHREYQFVKVGPFLKRHTWCIKRYGLQKQILHFPHVGLQDGGEITELYNCADVLVMPSLYEGFGMPLVEAFACGCPVICSDIPPFREIGQDAAVFFDQKSLNSLEAALENVFNDKDLRDRLIKNGLLLSKKYNWQTCANATYKVYEEIYNRI